MRAIAGALLGLLVGLAGGWFSGHHYGALSVAAERDAGALERLGELIGSHKQLIGEAQSASTQMRRALAQRAQRDEQSTKEIRDALAATADRRVDCDVPADVMRQLDAAWERAAAAAAGGVRGALPGAGAPDGTER